MVTFYPRKTDHGTAFDCQLARLIALADDMKEIRAGVPPERLAADPPILERWMAAQRPAMCLAGLSSGHPLLPGEGRPIVTSDLCLIAEDQTWARAVSALVPPRPPGRQPAPRFMTCRVTTDGKGGSHGSERANLPG